MLPWHIGLKKNPQFFDWNFFSNNSFLNKTKEICAIASNKTYTSGHVDRLNFCRLCSQKILNCDLFGRGIRDFEDKIDFLPNYKYQIVIENCSIPDYWTEKLADSFLAGCYTFYYGCKNIKDYFPENSYTLIDIYKPEESIRIIRDVIRNKTYEKNIEEIQKSKSKLLNEYNIFNLLNTICIDKSAKRKIIVAENNVSGFSLLNRFKTIVKRKLRGIGK